MKITFICPFNLNRLTGTPIRAVTTIKAVQPIFDEVHIITHSKTCAQLENVKIHTVNSPSTPVKFPFFWKSCISILLEIKPQLIHAFTPLGAAPAILAQNILKQSGMVFESHGISKLESKNLGYSPLTSNFLDMLEKVTLKKSSVIITVSHTLKEKFSTLGIREEKMHVIWGPVNLKIAEKARGNDVRRKLNVEDSIVFGYFGNDAPWQGVQNIFRASDVVLSKTDNVMFLFGGLSPKKYKKLRSKNRIFLGIVPRSKIFQYMKACDVLLSTRLGTGVAYYQYPHKLSEYLASGRAVIGTDIGDQAGIIRMSGAGIVVNSNDYHALASTMLHMLNCPRRTLRKMGDRALDFAKKEFSLEAMQQKLSVVYNEALKISGILDLT